MVERNAIGDVTMRKPAPGGEDACTTALQNASAALGRRSGRNLEVHVPLAIANQLERSSCQFRPILGAQAGATQPAHRRCNSAPRLDAESGLVKYPSMPAAAQARRSGSLGSAVAAKMLQGASAPARSSARSRRVTVTPSITGI